MRVAELRDLLATLPDDMLVSINARHVVMVERRFAARGTGLASVPCSCPDCNHTHTRFAAVEYVWPERLELSHHSTRDPRADEPPPPVQYRGRWTKAMRAAIDAHTEEPDR